MGLSGKGRLGTSLPMDLRLLSDSFVLLFSMLRTSSWGGLSSVGLPWVPDSSICICLSASMMGPIWRRDAVRSVALELATLSGSAACLGGIGAVATVGGIGDVLSPGVGRLMSDLQSEASDLRDSSGSGTCMVEDGVVVMVECMYGVLSPGIGRLM